MGFWLDFSAGLRRQRREYRQLVLGRLTLPLESSLNVPESTVTDSSEDYASRDYSRDLCSGLGGADNGQLRSDAGSALAHSLKAEMSISALIQNRGSDSHTVVRYPDGEIMRVGKFYFHSAAA